MNYEEHTSGDEYYLIYQDVHQLHDVFLDFKRSTLVRIALTTRASNPIEVSTGHGVHLGAPFAEVLNTYGERYLSSSTVGERYEYMDLHSKLFIIMENVPDFEGGILNYLFLEKYDLAKPYAIDTFEKERIDMEMKVSTSN
ncbi:hypothetical protein [Caldalkalibacillus mannanilyticus]|uniref:hypothetical protein n=1 Tax=Caldalkalibacillus mannanilyticus TaxID=1418 RepID=UPI00046A62DE|nr:hypothetical protein [Caldalkalibacillus mannanilyticus]